ncbi:hypothetical protein GVAV_000385 [Gurleya vavrai]
MNYFLFYFILCCKTSSKASNLTKWKFHPTRKDLLDHRLSNIKHQIPYSNNQKIANKKNFNQPENNKKAFLSFFSRKFTNKVEDNQTSNVTESKIDHELNKNKNISKQIEVASKKITDQNPSISSHIKNNNKISEIANSKDDQISNSLNNKEIFEPLPDYTTEKLENLQRTRENNNSDSIVSLSQKYSYIYEKRDFTIEKTFKKEDNNIDNYKNPHIIVNIDEHHIKHAQKDSRRKTIYCNDADFDNNMFARQIQKVNSLNDIRIDIFDDKCAPEHEKLGLEKQLDISQKNYNFRNKSVLIEPEQNFKKIISNFKEFLDEKPNFKQKHSKQKHSKQYNSQSLDEKHLVKVEKYTKNQNKIVKITYLKNTFIKIEDSHENIFFCKKYINMPVIIQVGFSYTSLENTSIKFFYILFVRNFYSDIRIHLKNLEMLFDKNLFKYLDDKNFYLLKICDFIYFRMFNKLSESVYIFINNNIEEYLTYVQYNNKNYTNSSFEDIFLSEFKSEIKNLNNYNLQIESTNF